MAIEEKGKQVEEKTGRNQIKKSSVLTENVNKVWSFLQEDARVAKRCRAPNADDRFRN